MRSPVERSVMLTIMQLAGRNAKKKASFGVRTADACANSYWFRKGLSVLRRMTSARFSGVIPIT